MVSEDAEGRVRGETYPVRACSSASGSKRTSPFKGALLPLLAESSRWRFRAARVDLAAVFFRSYIAAAIRSRWESSKMPLMLYFRIRVVLL